jgi:serine protease Do
MSLPSAIALVVLISGSPLGFAQTVEAPKPLAQFNASIRSLTRRASPAIVEITVTGYGATDGSAASDDGQRTSEQVWRQRSSGSGVLVDPAGYIMTSAHVIERATALEVIVGSATDGSRAGALEAAPVRRFSARVLGVDKDTDLALLRIDATDLPALHFGDSDAVAQGDVVLAIGSPLLLRNSLSLGVVSAPARGLTDDDPVLYIQTDASLNPGASGGGLIDINGNLIGLNTSILSKSGGNEGLGFAIPSNLVRFVYQQLRATGTVSRGSLGVVVQSVTPALARGLSLRVQHGVLVTDMEPVTSGSPSGLQRKDVILSLDDRPVQSARQFNEAIYRRPAGEKIALNVQRGAEIFSLTAKVDTWTAPFNPLAIVGTLENNLVSRLGIFCIEIDKNVAEALPDLRTQYGLVVVARSAESQATFLDVKPGDVIHELNNLPIASLDLFRKRIDEFHRGDSVALQIERHGRLRYTAFEIE